MAETSLGATAAPFGTATRFFERVLPAGLFGAISMLAVRSLIQSWTGPIDAGSEAWTLNALGLAHSALAVAFSSVVTILFLIRRPPTGARASSLDLGTALVGSYVMWIAVLQPNTTNDWRALVCSDLLMIGGLGFTIYALLTLRACFGVAPEARGLVTTGPYRWVRHPVYLGEFVTALGGLLPVLSPLTLLVFAAFCVAQARRMVLEEAVLSAAFDEYRAYRERTPALMPWPARRSQP